MTKHEINVYIEPKLKVSIKKIWFKNTIKKILTTLKIKIPSELGLVLTNNKTMQQLNKTYRGKDEPTDVLAFHMVSLCDKKTNEPKWKTPPDGVFHLGEIVISYPQAIIQAQDKGHDTKHELIILMIHGVLHLLGYDHEQSSKKTQDMRTKEKSIVKRLT